MKRHLLQKKKILGKSGAACSSQHDQQERRPTANDSETAQDMTNIDAAAELMSMLQKLNRQLENMQQTDDGSQSTNNSNSGGDEGALLQQAQPQTTSQSSSGGSQSTLVQLQELLQQLESKKSGNGEQLSAQSQQQQAGVDGAQAVGRQEKTNSQLLADAQYQLAEQLEESLKKLQQVIYESEKIAGQISSSLQDN